MRDTRRGAGGLPWTWSPFLNSPIVASFFGLPKPSRPNTTDASESIHIANG
jgi:hypothetical protein